MNSIIHRKGWFWSCCLLGLLVSSIALGDMTGNSLKPVSFDKVKVKDQFWDSRLNTLENVTIPHGIKKTEGALNRLRMAAAILRDGDGPKPGPDRFVSSDLYKVMEAAAYTLMIKPNAELEKLLDSNIDVIAAAQQDDGYLYVDHITGNIGPWTGQTPYSCVVASHELYNMGHMYEGAVAYYRATGKDKWLKIAEKSAQHINKVFFEGDPNYNHGISVMQAPGHEEIELALCKLYRVTGKPLYLDMAKKFLDIRGVTYRPRGDRIVSPTYAQQHKPVIEQEHAVGHAVRAGYLYSAMADVSALTGDMRYASAAEKIWHDIVDTKMHIIGGLGAVRGIEGFGKAYELPNEDTYNETCAAIANVFFNYRMYLLTGDAKYFDVAEVSLLNNALAGISLQGDTFFYVNPLETDGVKKFNNGFAGRFPWLGVACCPPNIARLIAQIAGYMYSYTEDKIYLTLYGSSETVIPLESGKIGLIQKSDYPLDGRIELEINPEKDQKFALKLRIPTWARTEQFMPGDLYYYTDNLNPQWTLSVNGKNISVKVEKGFASIEMTWKAGDKVVLDLPMPIRWNGCNKKVEANKGRMAISCGPLVYCAEGIDNDRAVEQFFVQPNSMLAEAKTSTIEAGVLAGLRRITIPAKKVDRDAIKDTELHLIPYYAWSNRGQSAMITWIGTQKELTASND